MSRYDYTRLDELLHSRIRLAAMAALAGVEEADFGWLKEHTGATDGNLSVHLRKLEEAGYLQSEKGFAGRRPRTGYRMTDAGRRAFRDYVEKLAGMLDMPESQPET